ncbi:hypothetical protein F5B21DRAFT_505644 [Xylaria acuta]|nr:hypothetical protein F5B21DRAFT_505644 [Xylaria acuta]
MKGMKRLSHRLSSMECRNGVDSDHVESDRIPRSSASGIASEQHADPSGEQQDWFDLFVDLDHMGPPPLPPPTIISIPEDSGATADAERRIESASRILHRTSTTVVVLNSHHHHQRRRLGVIKPRGPWLRGRAAFEAAWGPDVVREVGGERVRCLQIET